MRPGYIIAGVIAIIAGILILIWPSLMQWILGIVLIIWGIFRVMGRV